MVVFWRGRVAGTGRDRTGWDGMGRDGMEHFEGRVHCEPFRECLGFFGWFFLGFVLGVLVLGSSFCFRFRVLFLFSRFVFFVLE